VFISRNHSTISREAGLSVLHRIKSQVVVSHIHQVQHYHSVTASSVSVTFRTISQKRTEAGDNKFGARGDHQSVWSVSDFGSKRSKDQPCTVRNLFIPPEQSSTAARHGTMINSMIPEWLLMPIYYRGRQAGVAGFSDGDGCRTRVFLGASSRHAIDHCRRVESWSTTPQTTTHVDRPPSARL